MAEYVANAVQNVALNSPILFNSSIPCNTGCVFHEDETGVFILRGKTNNCFARYQVTFNGNVAIPTGVLYNSDSEFMKVAGHADINKLYEVVDELMECLALVNPKLYNGVLAKLGG